MSMFLERAIHSIHIINLLTLRVETTAAIGIRNSQDFLSQFIG